jgi:hypothetical protein
VTRYFFDLYEGTKVSPDEMGTEFATLEAAIAGAKRLLPELASARHKLQGDECHFDVVVRDGAGEAVFTATLAMVSARLGMPQLSARHP